MKRKAVVISPSQSSRVAGLDDVVDDAHDDQPPPPKRSASNINIIMKKVNMGSVPRELLQPFQVWQMSQEVDPAGNELKMSDMFSSEDVQLWMQHLCEPAATARVMNHEEKQCLQTIYDFLMYNGSTTSAAADQGALYPRSLWISATTFPANVSRVNDLVVANVAVDGLIERLREPNGRWQLMRLTLRSATITRLEQMTSLLSMMPRLIELDVVNYSEVGGGEVGGDAVATAIAQYHRISHHLTSLTLSENRISPVGAAALAQSETLLNLPKLDLNCNRIGEAGVAALAESRTLRSLTSLDLRSNQVGDAGAAALAQSPNLPNLTSLHLSWNFIHDAGSTALAQSKTVMNLTSLNLSWNRIGHEGAAALAQSANLRNLTSLDLCCNRIGDAGVAALAESQTLMNLTKLNLSANKIGDLGAAALAQSEMVRNLTSLDLRWNQFGPEGAVVLAKSQNLRNLGVFCAR